MMDLVVRDAVERDYSQASNEECRVATLEWVNMLRGEYVLDLVTELPAGDRGLASSCVLVNALTGISDGSRTFQSDGRSALACPDDPKPPDGQFLRYGREGQVIHRMMPPLVAEFVRRFDSGVYPDLLRESEAGVFKLWG